MSQIFLPGGTSFIALRRKAAFRKLFKLISVVPNLKRFLRACLKKNKFNPKGFRVFSAVMPGFTAEIFKF